MSEPGSRRDRAQAPGGGGEPVAGDGRERILNGVRAALRERAPAPHPGPFIGARPQPRPEPVEELTALLEAAGATVVHRPDEPSAAAWLSQECSGHDAAAVGEQVPEALRPPLPAAEPAIAPLGVSMARGAVAETGSLLMDARDGRRAQLLVPRHIVFVDARTVHGTLREALAAVATDLPSALGLHSGPSKSADIGQIMVTGVHGPGELVVVVIAAP